MATVTLNIPILVQRIHIEERPHYHLRPLFIGHPVTTSRQFDGALNNLKREIKDYLKGFRLKRSNLDQFLWFLFNPALSFRQMEVDIHLNKQYLKGNITVVSFELQGYTFAYLPGFDNFLFLAGKGPEVTGGLKEQVRRVVQRLMQRHKDREEGFDPSHWFSEKKEFISELSLQVHLDHESFKFRDQGRNMFFSLFSESLEFNGAIEVERVGYDLNSLFPSGLRRAYFMDDKVERIYQAVFRRRNTPLAIIGPEGVGRHTLVHEVVWRHQSRYYPSGGEPKERVWHLDPTRIIAGMSVVGMWEKRFEAIIRFLRKPVEDQAHADKMLVDNPVALLRIGRSAQSNHTLSDVLRPYLEKRQLQLLIIATPEEWKVIQEKDRRFSDLFQVIRLSEPPLDEAVRIILRRRRELETENDAVISVQAVSQLLAIHRNYLRNKALPGGVLKLLQQLAVKHRSGTVDAPQVREEFKAFSGLEESIFDADKSLEPGEPERQLQQQLVGQPEAVRSLADAVHLIRARLSDRTKPISSFLFIGPTGVGKTQAAKVLCHHLMGSEEFLLRFDMNEYIDPDAVNRLIGDYYQPEGQLTGKVRYRPFSILLLDEIEKAHPKVHNLLLQVLDDGRLTDSLGRTVDFSNTVIIMTSNVGAREVTWQPGYRSTQQNEAAIYRKAVEKQFRPEFINRIDKIVIFNPLELDHILRIARLQIKELLQRDGFVRRTTILNISKDALEWVARRGFDARMGGRALKRQIERDLTALSADQLISTYSDNPIILDIFFGDGRLLPSITELRFAASLEEDFLPALPDEQQGLEFYRRLAASMERIFRRIEAFEEKQASNRVLIETQRIQELDWLYYDFKNKALETKEQVKTMMLGFRDKHFNKLPAIALRLKRGQVIQRRPASRGERENLKDRLFQEEGLREISEAYYFASSQFDSLKSEFVDHFLNVSFLNLFTIGFLGGSSEEVVMQFHSLITAMGAAEIDFLIDRYARLFDLLDLPHKVDKKNRQITIKGYAVVELLAGEEGIHLFYTAHRNPLPIYIELRAPNEERKEQVNYRIIRIYDGTSTLTDLRTGYSNAVNITAYELKLLLFAGIEPGIRKEIAAL